MNTAALLGPYQPESAFAWIGGSPITCHRFLSEVATLADQLPENATVINLVEDRFRFFVGFAAALVRGQTTLLPPGRAPKVLAQITNDHANSYCLIDGQGKVEGLPSFHILSTYRNSKEHQFVVPQIPTKQIAVVAFTSGSTGTPRPNPKTWGSLVAVAQHTGARLGLSPTDNVTVVATVPHQHMFGLEASLLLPTQFGLPFHTGRPLYPEDIRSALGSAPPRRILVTTPLHIKACVTEKTQFPKIDFILSATAPLPIALAQQAETLFDTKVFEVYGFVEAGSVATRRTVAGDSWQLLDGISFAKHSDHYSLRADYLREPVPFPDHISLQGPRTFFLQSRHADLVNIAGHRGSLGDLNRKLNEIEGVQDGVFLFPGQDERSITRLTAFVVAPGKSADQILSDLRTVINPVFLPRPLYLVPILPRNETGKLTRESLLELARQLQCEDHRGL
ncbi:MAG: acyl-CoA synthetase [Nitrospiraceae bacterium]|nr:acyl-CoA synthetase [Nitrospiraceae bacterium]